MLEECLALDSRRARRSASSARPARASRRSTKLVQRLYLPNEGQVLLDGADLSQVDPAWLRSHIGVVLQENLLFNRTIHENIAFANPAMPRAQVIEIARLAGADEFIDKLPEGYDTMIEERGANLSGGQRQRIAIARALATNPRILIFDEATSALDYESERIIQRNMRRIVKNRTVIIIAHRLAAVRGCDRIVGMADGRIVEIGSHEELSGVRAGSTRIFGGFRASRSRSRHELTAARSTGRPGVLPSRPAEPSAVARSRFATRRRVVRPGVPRARAGNPGDARLAGARRVHLDHLRAGRRRPDRWAYFGRIDIIASAQGKFQPTGRVKVIEPLETGKVAAIHVANGSLGQGGRHSGRTRPLGRRGGRARRPAPSLPPPRAEAARRAAALAAARAAPFDPARAIAWPDDIAARLREREERVLAADLGQLAATVASFDAQRAQKTAERDNFSRRSRRRRTSSRRCRSASTCARNSSSPRMPAPKPRSSTPPRRCNIRSPSSRCSRASSLPPDRALDVIARDSDKAVAVPSCPTTPRS